MRRTLALMTVLGMLFVGLAVPAGADPGARPFKATFSGEVFWTGDVDCLTSLRTNSTGTGNATHLGKVAMTSDHCTPPGLDYGIGEMVFFAANDDEIHLEYWGRCEDFGDLVVGDILSCTVEFDVVGGTGRFIDAEGSARGYVHIEWLGFDAPSMPAWWAYRGQIGY